MAMTAGCTECLSELSLERFRAAFLSGEVSEFLKHFGDITEKHKSKGEREGEGKREGEREGKIALESWMAECFGAQPGEVEYLICIMYGKGSVEKIRWLHERFDFDNLDVSVMLEHAIANPCAEEVIEYMAEEFNISWKTNGDAIAHVMTCLFREYDVDMANFLIQLFQISRGNLEMPRSKMSASEAAFIDRLDFSLDNASWRVKFAGKK